VTAITAIAITGMGLTGVLRMTWVQDNLAHVLDHSHTDETSGTWTGQACPGHGLALGADVDNATLRHLAAGSEIADLTWEAPDDLTTEHGLMFDAAISAHQTDAPMFVKRGRRTFGGRGSGVAGVVVRLVIAGLRTRQGWAARVERASSY
jgi:hypothetical protein